MRTATCLLLVFFCSSFVFMDGKYWLAGETLIKSLRSRSPNFEGIALRDYSYRDLNHDKTYEIVETINSFEEKTPGFLNTEISPAFELHRIYSYNAGAFKKNYEPFGEYLENRIAFYEFWKRQIQNPAQLSDDSQALVKENKASFLKALDRLIGIMKTLQA